MRGTPRLRGSCFLSVHGEGRYARAQAGKSCGGPGSGAAAPDLSGRDPDGLPRAQRERDRGAAESAARGLARVPGGQEHAPDPCDRAGRAYGPRVVSRGPDGRGLRAGRSGRAGAHPSGVHQAVPQARDQRRDGRGAGARSRGRAGAGDAPQQARADREVARYHAGTASELGHGVDRAGPGPGRNGARFEARGTGTIAEIRGSGAILGWEGIAMAAIEQIVEQIEALSALDLSKLVKALEEKFGVSAAAPMIAMAAPGAADTGAGAAVAEEQTEFDAVLTAVGDKKIQVIKVVRELTGLGLKEAKDLVDGAPKPVKEKVSKQEADTIKTKLTEVGATVEIK